METTGVRRSGSDMELVENWDIMMPQSIAEAYAPISCIDREKERIRYMAEHRLDASKVIVVCATGKHRDVLRVESDVMDILVLGCVPRKITFYEDEKRSILIREYVLGESLGGAIDRMGSFSEDEVRTLGEDLCVLVSELYERHLSVKPESLSPRNIIVCKDGRMRFVEPEGIEYCSDFAGNWAEIEEQIGNLMHYLLTENSENGDSEVTQAFSKVIARCRAKSYGNVTKLYRAIEASEPSACKKRRGATGIVAAAAVLVTITLAIPFIRNIGMNPSGPDRGIGIDIPDDPYIPGSEPVVNDPTPSPAADEQDESADSTAKNE